MMLMLKLLVLMILFVIESVDVTPCVFMVFPDAGYLTSSTMIEFQTLSLCFFCLVFAMPL